MTVPPGLIITAILVVNNLRDLENDRRAGKHTMAVRLGEKGTKIQYLVCMVIAYFVLIPVAWAGMIPWAAMLAWLSLPLAIQSAKVMWTQKGRPLNAALAKTGQTALFFSLLFWGGVIVQLTNFHLHHFHSNQSTLKYKPKPNKLMATIPAYMAG